MIQMIPHTAFEPYEKLSPFEVKDKLLQLAKDSARKSAIAMLNAGRGNPNWVATTPREAFFLLGQFGIQESKRVWDLPDLGGMPQKAGIAHRFEAFLKTQPETPGRKLLQDTLPYAVEELNFDADDFVHELVDSIIGDNYPVPDRMLVHAEKVVRKYLDWAMCDSRPPEGTFDLYAVEGGTAAMCYTFKSLKSNKILNPGDTIALGVPIFTPYIEMPHLSDYGLNIVPIRATQENLFQYSDEELQKLEDPKIKAFFLVNPGNPTSAGISQDVIGKIVHLVKTKRPDLIILTDDVYGTFIKGFRSLMADLPENTIGVYSYSKYFGCTGWRLGVIAIHENNVIDKMIAAHPPQILDELDKRYGALTLEPRKLKFIDRIVADSRDVALNHTAGLSLPQQVQMTLFSMFQLLDREERYRHETMKIVKRRVAATVKGLGLEETVGTHPLFAGYYAIIDFDFWLRKYLDDDIADFVKENFHPLDIVARLAHDHAVVLLNGGGFEAPNWSVRISFANLPDEVYEDMGRMVRSIAATYVEAYRFAHPDRRVISRRTGEEVPRRETQGVSAGEKEYV